MGQAKSRVRPVTRNNAGSGASEARLVRIDAVLLRTLMETAGVTSEALAVGAGVSSAYVRQARLGFRPRVSREFLRLAGDEIGERLSESGRVALALTLQDKTPDGKVK